MQATANVTTSATAALQAKQDTLLSPRFCAARADIGLVVFGAAILHATAGRGF